MSDSSYEIFLVAPPGLEAVLCAEAGMHDFAAPRAVPGGVVTQGGWPEVWRANLVLRGAVRVLVRIARFRAQHLAQLDKRARKLDWAGFLRPDVAVSVDASCHKSRIYHSGAAAQRVADAIAQEHGAPIAREADLAIKVRIENDDVTISIDTSGAPLHKRGLKGAVHKAPMRETMAALFLRQAGYHGGETLCDPLCGSGTFVIEAAEMAMGLQPGRARAFAFEALAGFDTRAFATMRGGQAIAKPDVMFFGSDRDAGAIRMSQDNAQSAGVAAFTRFTQADIAAVTAPDCAPGLVMVNPPYGGRLGAKSSLAGFYARFGQAMRAQFTGWRVGMITSEDRLAKASGLPFAAFPTVDNGGTRVRLYLTERLGA